MKFYLPQKGEEAHQKDISKEYRSKETIQLKDIFALRPVPWEILSEIGLLIVLYQTLYGMPHDIPQLQLIIRENFFNDGP